MKSNPVRVKKETAGGFTILELVLVIVIVGILATLALVSDSKLIEKEKNAEAKTTLSLMRKAQEIYRLEFGEYTDVLESLAVEIPTSCTSTHYFSYSTTADRGEATRCVSGGKSPDSSVPYTVDLYYEAGTWGGSAGYQ